MLQGNLLTAVPAAGGPGPTAEPFERVALDATSWVDVCRGFLAGADDLLFELMASVDWRVGRRRMYDREVDDPRLARWYRRTDADPHPVLAAARAAVEARYARAFGGVGLNLYRHGRDSVAWHADRELRRLDDTLVAIVVMGERRPFLLRPTGGGRSIDLGPASGDLVVMGGRCQADWEHAVPKTARPVGPRLSASWRWSPSGYATMRPGGYLESRVWRTLAR